MGRAAGRLRTEDRTVAWEEDRGRRTEDGLGADGGMGPADGWDRLAAETGAGKKGSQLKSYPLSQPSRLTRNMQTGPCLKRNNPN